MFALERIRQNPLLIRQMRRTQRVTTQMAIRRSIIISVGVFLFTVFALIGQMNGAVYVMLMCMAWTFMMLPVMSALMAASITAQERRNDGFKLVCLTTISNYRLVEGHVVSAIYFVRNVLILMCGFTPLLAFGLIFAFGFHDFSTCLIRRIDSFETCIDQLPAMADTFVAILSVSILIASIWGITVFGMIAGVTLAILLRNEPIAIFSTAGLMLYVMVTTFSQILELNRLESILNYSWLNLPLSVLILAMLWSSQFFVRRRGKYVQTQE
jgi:hypothetical protein